MAGHALIAKAVEPSAHSVEPSAHSDDSAAQSLAESRGFYQSGQYFKSARYAFAAIDLDDSVRPEAYSWITLGLSRAHLYNAASYFFIRTLQSEDRTAIRRVLTQTQDMLVRLGGADLLRKYLIRHTHYDDYDAINRSAYLYSLAKDALLSGDSADGMQRAVGYVNGISQSSPLWPFALEMRGSAYAILGKNDAAVKDFVTCASKSQDIAKSVAEDSPKASQLDREAQDLEARCLAGRARTLYQMEHFEEAERAYDRIEKKSLVWPDILFEQAWNAFAEQQYNRTLGKLVSYKSPALGFVFNTEVDVLRAQAYLALCLYNDANGVINEFNGKYSKVGEQVKQFVEGNSSNLAAFYNLGKQALGASLYSGNGLHQMANRFVRGPYFQNLVAVERDVSSERAAIRQFDLMQPGIAHPMAAQGFPGFLEQVLRWRLKSITLLGGAYVKNSFLDYHSALISDFEKMAFIKLEMLKRAKDVILYKSESGDRTRGNVEPKRRDDQYYWSFNGEFWNDELGDYVFGLESECKGNGA